MMLRRMRLYSSRNISAGDFISYGQNRRTIHAACRRVQHRAFRRLPERRSLRLRFFVVDFKNRPIVRLAIHM